MQLDYNRLDRIREPLVTRASADREMVELVGPGGYFLMSAKTWRRVLRLAHGYGWHPAGTEAPEGLPLIDPWPGSYIPQSGQKLTDEDARALVEALEQALERIPDDGAAITDPDLAMFGGDNKPWLRNLAGYCRAGGFYVW